MLRTPDAFFSFHFPFFFFLLDTLTRQKIWDYAVAHTRISLVFIFSFFFFFQRETPTRSAEKLVFFSANLFFSRQGSTPGRNLLQQKMQLSKVLVATIFCTSPQQSKSEMSREKNKLLRHTYTLMIGHTQAHIPIMTHKLTHNTYHHIHTITVPSTNTWRA